jgi:hypothetical protein
LSDKLSADELFHDRESVDEFIQLLSNAGLVVSFTDDGMILGMTLDKLQELVGLATVDSDKRVIIFVKNDDQEISRELLN